MRKQVLMSIIASVSFMAFTPTLSFSEEGNSVAASVKETGRDMKKGLKKGGRKIKDETCELVNGKMECAAKKMKHKIQNGTDEVKDKTNLDH